MDLCKLCLSPSPLMFALQTVSAAMKSSQNSQPDKLYR